MNGSALLTRDRFRESVFARDKYKCVICQAPAQDAHHLIERRTFPDGGYYLDNGTSLCGDCHIKAEQTVLTVEEIRAAAGITTKIVPPHVYQDDLFDKWLNPILPNGTRYMGELFDDPSVQKVLASGGVLNQFVRYVKYPRTLHLPWSPGADNKDERTMDDFSSFDGEEVVVTAKLDGENTTWYNDHIHARSLDYSPHPSRNWIKKLHGEIAWQLPDNYRLCGENLYAKHSILYQNLETYFYVFSLWNDKNHALSWDETVEWAALLGLKTTPILYQGPWDERLIRNLNPTSFNGDPCEGYVVRVKRQFPFRDFRKCVAKWVRADHVQTHAFWRNQQVVPNGLKDTNAQ